MHGPVISCKSSRLSETSKVFWALNCKKFVWHSNPIISSKSEPVVDVVGCVEKPRSGRFIIRGARCG